MFKNLKKTLAKISRRFLLIAITFVVIVALAVWGFYVFKSKPIIAMFAGGAPGTAAAFAAIDFAHDYHIDLVDNYSLFNSSASELKKYLAYADAAGVMIGVPMGDFMGDTDLDKDQINQQYHNAYGHSNDERVANMISFLQRLPQWGRIGRFFIDERPANSAELPKWKDALKKRTDQLKATGKPVMLSVENGADNAEFFTELRKYVDQIMVDYYPYPVNAESGGSKYQYGTIEHIRDISRDLVAAAGKGACLAIQDFSHYVTEPDVIKQFNFPAEPPTDSIKGAPPSGVMVEMARLGLEQGVQCVELFHFDIASASELSGQITQTAIAAREIRALSEFNK